MPLFEALWRQHDGMTGQCALTSQPGASKMLAGLRPGHKFLAAPDEIARNHLWLIAVEPLVVEVPPGLERLSIRLDGQDKSQWIPTDKVKLCPGSQDRVLVSGNRTGVLAAGPHRSSEHFNAGETLEISHLEKCLSRPRAAASPSPTARSPPERARPSSAPRQQTSLGSRAGDLRRLRLGKRELVELRALVPGPEKGECLASATSSPKHEAGDAEWEKTLKKLPEDLRSVRVPGGLFHVLAYPLAGDPTKVLLRPAKRSVVDATVLQSMGETLLSQCAKAGRWDLVETLLRAGVPCPDLEEEFSDICGRWPAVRRRWSRDLAAAVGSQRQSLLGLASVAIGDKPLRILSVLREQGKLLFLDECGKGQSAFLVALAEASRWDLVVLLLEELGKNHGPGMESIAPFAESAVLAKAPPNVVELVQGLIMSEKLKGVRARSLKEYFERQLRGEVMGKTLAPNGFVLCEGVLSANDAREDPLQIFERGVRLRDAVAAEGAEVAFVSISNEELDAAKEAIAGKECAMLPVNLSGKAASQRDPTGGGAWLAVLCPAGYLGRNRAGGLALHIPAGRFPTPYVPRSTVSVIAVTPCCGMPVEGVLLHVDGRRAGITDASGTLSLALPAGTHTLTAPGQSHASKVVKVKQASCADETPIRFTLSGELFLYLQDMTVQDEEEEVQETNYGVMLCASKDQIPSAAIPFPGISTMLRRCPSSNPARRKEFSAVSTLIEQVTCDGALNRLQAKLGMWTPYANQRSKKILVNLASADSVGLLASCFYGWWMHVKQQGQALSTTSTKLSYFPNLDAPVWVGWRQMCNECATALLFRSPLRLGNLISEVGSRVASERTSSRRGTINEDLRSMSKSLSESLKTLPPASHTRHGITIASARPGNASGTLHTRPGSVGSGVRSSGRRPPQLAAAAPRRPPSRQRERSARAIPGGKCLPSCEQRGRPLFFDPYEVDFFYA